MINFFHRLMNPHCEHCYALHIEKQRCNTCDVLRTELELERVEKNRLLDQLLIPQNFAESTRRETPKPIRQMPTPWPVKQQMLEAEDRHAAKLKAEQLKALETEVGIESNG